MVLHSLQARSSLRQRVDNHLNPLTLLKNCPPTPTPNPRPSRPPRQDGNFSEEAFRDTLNAELANTVGNMLNRTLGLLHKYCEGTLPASAADAAPDGHPLRAAAAEGAARAAAAFGELAPHAALEAAVAVAQRGNLLLEETAPWTALKKVRGGVAAGPSG
jgi:methionyl-tRNA synthetase